MGNSIKPHVQNAEKTGVLQLARSNLREVQECGKSVSIKPQVQNAEKTGVLQLSRSNLGEFPKDLSHLSQVLRTLDVSDNRLVTIPSSIRNFTLIKHLTLNNNRLTHLPEELGNLKKLETLSLSRNRLSSLPSSLSNLNHLRTVNLSENKFKDFPLVFCSLEHLEVLDLSRNAITSIPDGIESLQATELNLNQNQLSEISESVADCPRLKVLRMEENCLLLSAIPVKILTDSQVSLLTVDGNLFDLKDLHNTEGYEKYMERYTATKKKMF